MIATNRKKNKSNKEKNSRMDGVNMLTVKRIHHQLQHNTGGLELAGYVQSTWQTDVDVGSVA
jgi:hypothetical protein